MFDAPPVPIFRHLHRLSDDRAVFADAEGDKPLRDHGYRLDDAAQALIVVCREPRPAPNVSGLARRYLDFVLSAVQPSGACHRRMSDDGAWSDDSGVGDGWGRAAWSLGVAATAAPTGALQAQALAGFNTAVKQRSPELRPMAYAALGAGDLLGRQPAHAGARDLLQDAVDIMWWEDCDDAWPWPEAQLGYANGALAEAMILGGDLLEINPALSRGLEMLAFLLEAQTRDGHLSIGPATGERVPDGPQRPLEVAAIADACAAAHRVTADRRWRNGIEMAWRWFLGDNDAGVAMFDPAAGGGYDTLDAAGHSADQGAESTLAMLSTAQHARRMTAQVRSSR